MILRSKPQFDNHDTIYRWFVTSNSNWQFYSHHSHVCFPDINEGGYLIGNVTIKSMANEIPGKNSQRTPFCKLCCNLPLIQKYVEIYHFLGTRVWWNRVFHGTRVPWISKNSSFTTNSSFKKVKDPYIFPKQW